MPFKVGLLEIVYAWFAFYFCIMHITFLVCRFIRLIYIGIHTQKQFNQNRQLLCQSYTPCGKYQYQKLHSHAYQVNYQ